MTELCSSCSIVPPRPGQRTCRECHNAYKRAFGRRYRDPSPEERRKANTRAYTGVLVRRGKIARGPCEVCLAPVAEAHHPDYGDPRTVRWLCRPHHRIVHVIARGEVSRFTMATEGR